MERGGIFLASHTTQRSQFHIQHYVMLTQRSNSLNVLNFNFRKEQYTMLPEDDRMIEICRSVLNVLM